MKLSEQLKVIAPTDRIRIVQGKRGNRDPEYDPGNKILYCGWMGQLQHTDAETEF